MTAPSYETAASLRSVPHVGARPRQQPDGVSPLQRPQIEDPPGPGEALVETNGARHHGEGR
jgi:hypothetical protein